MFHANLANIGLLWDYHGWHVDVHGRYGGPQQLTDANTSLPGAAGDLAPGQRTQEPDDFLLNLGVAKVVPINLGVTRAVKFALHIDNLLDQHYYSNAQTNTDANNGKNPITGNQLLV
jgi:hypothetical protein